jgi:quinol monooxygenase YgiN
MLSKVKFTTRLLNMIIVQNTFHLLSKSQSAVIDLMKNMVQLCRKEWENADSLQGHYQTEHMDDFLSKLVHHLDKPIITRSYFSPEEEAAVADNKASKKPKAQQTIH